MGRIGKNLNTKTEKAESFAVRTNNQKDQKMLLRTEMSVFDLQKLLETPSHKLKLLSGSIEWAQNKVKVK